MPTKLKMFLAGTLGKGVTGMTVDVTNECLTQIDQIDEARKN